MVDTITQYERIRDEIDQAVAAVIRSGAYINGPVVQQFRENLAAYLGVEHVIPCANGTDALQIALMALQLRPGDEVITTAFTFVATAEVIALLGLKPVFVDVEPDTYNLNPQLIEAAITDKTRAIIPVHLFGQPANMAPIMELARQHGLYVIEDNAQAIGAAYTFADGQRLKTGAIGHIGTTSFYPSKNLGAYGDGGAIFTQDEELAARMWMICNHGSSRRYYHDVVGVNSRLDAIQAAILDIKLRHLDAYNQARIQAADQYDQLLKEEAGIGLPLRAAYAHHVFHQYTIRIKEGREKRDAIQAYLSQQHIPAMIYYPVPLHLQAAYRGYGYKPGDLPVTEQLSEEVLSLPMHSELTQEQTEHVSGHLKAALKQAAGIC
ncbi:MAG: DegT/DnrJ/EryC1/StrS family aminotransferase [Bacteroidetes bacterium]|nr:MAG: DegT/DnrJ/EryC1/StrS family aminotransferase [Bacteroidota bacterium]